MRIARRQAYLLAAGRGRRAGGPKAWLMHDGKTLLETQLAFLSGLVGPESVAVSVQEPWLARCRRLDGRVSWVAVDPELPALGAVLALLKAAPLEHWTFFHHVDMPVWEEGLFQALSERVPAAEAAGNEALIPMEGGRGGHPALLSPRLGPSLSVLDPAEDRLDRWLATRRLERVEVPYRCIHENWNRGEGPSSIKTGEDKNAR